MSLLRAASGSLPVLLVLLLVSACRMTPVTVAPAQPTAYLTCPRSEPPPAPGQASLGPAGGAVATGHSELRVPAGALQHTAGFTIRDLPGDTVGVSIESTSPGVHFTSPATVIIDFARCSTTQVGNRDWAIWRFPAEGGPGVRLATSRQGRRAAAYTDRNSKFIIAD
jgi:hypothetical protein